MFSAADADELAAGSDFTGTTSWISSSSLELAVDADAAADGVEGVDDAGGAIEVMERDWLAAEGRDFLVGGPDSEAVESRARDLDSLFGLSLLSELP